MFIQKKIITSNASRKTTIFNFPWSQIRPETKLSWRKKSLGGRNSSGKRVIRTKSSLKKNIFIPHTNYLNNYKSFLMVTNLCISLKPQKMFLLVTSSSGFSTYIGAGEEKNLFSFLYHFQSSNFLKNLFKKPIFFQIINLPLLSPISHISIKPTTKSKYARSAGSVAKLINKNFYTHTSLVKLPSGVRKIFSLYSFTLAGAAALKEKQHFSNTKSGYWRVLGLRSQVRGVAMNPIDHPHGGRTKAIRYPRTPWGLTTKFK